MISNITSHGYKNICPTLLVGGRCRRMSWYLFHILWYHIYFIYLFSRFDLIIWNRFKDVKYGVVIVNQSTAKTSYLFHFITSKYIYHISCSSSLSLVAALKIKSEELLLMKDENNNFVLNLNFSSHRASWYSFTRQEQTCSRCLTMCTIYYLFRENQLYLAVATEHHKTSLTCLGRRWTAAACGPSTARATLPGSQTRWERRFI